MALRRFVPLAVFLSVSAAGLLAAGFAWTAAEDARRIRFDSTADDAVNRIQARIDQHMALLNSAQGFMLAHDEQPSGETYERFMRALDMSHRYAGIRAIGYAPLIKPGEEASVEAGFAANYGITRKVFPQSEAVWRAPVTLLSPLDEVSRSAIGFDMFSEPSRREAMLAALDAGGARATRPVKLVQMDDPAQSAGFLVYLPVPATSDPEVTASISPHLPVRGFLYASFRAEELFGAALAGFPMLPVAVVVRDTGAKDEQPLFRSAAEPAGTIGKNLSARRSLDVAGRNWRLDFHPTSAYPAPNTMIIPGALALLALLLASTLALLARSRERQYETMAVLNRASEKTLLDKDLMLQEMKHRIKNSIARVLAISRQTAAGAGSVEEFSSSFSARLQAMAASQDMLTRSHWQRADLAELLRTELEQVFGKSAGTIIEGPQVSLDERATQALGLTFHELATNALKYGGRLSDVSHLAVVWRLDDRPGERRLKLTWKELTPNAGLKPPEKIGFGTRLIEMNIVRELGGQIERHYGDDGLRIEISIPLKFSKNDKAA